MKIKTKRGTLEIQLSFKSKPNPMIELFEDPRDFRLPRRFGFRSEQWETFPWAPYREKCWAFVIPYFAVTWRPRTFFDVALEKIMKK